MNSTYISRSEDLSQEGINIQKQLMQIEPEFGLYALSKQRIICNKKLDLLSDIGSKG